MIKCIGTVCIFVDNQDRAKEFYLNKLGFDLRDDQPLYPGATNRWLAVVPKGAQTHVILYKIDENWEHYKTTLGKSQAVTFNVEDMATVCKDLKDKGVAFVQEPDVQPWGTHAQIRDSEGNTLLLVELPKA